jgi:hypothetical protein
MSATTEQYTAPLYRPLYSSAAKEAITALICCFGYLSNILTLVTMVKVPKAIGRKARLYVISLSCSDLLMAPALTTSLLLSKFGYLTEPVFSDVFDPEIVRRERASCITLACLLYIALISSLMTLAAMSLDRLLAIAKPVFYKTYMTEKAIKLLLMVKHIKIGE